MFRSSSFVLIETLRQIIHSELFFETMPSLINCLALSMLSYKMRHLSSLTKTSGKQKFDFFYKNNLCFLLEFVLKAPKYTKTSLVYDNDSLTCKQTKGALGGKTYVRTSAHCCTDIVYMISSSSQVKHH